MRMYGDVVNAVCYTLFTPAYLYLWWMQEKDTIGELQVVAPEGAAAASAAAARNVTLAFAWTMVFSWLSVWTRNPILSSLACLGMSGSIAGMNLYQWPHQGEAVVIPQFLWTLLIISGNRPLSFSYKISLGVVALLNAIVVAILCPLVSVYDALPTLLGAMAVHVMFHYYATQNGDGTNTVEIGPRLASIILAGAYASHVTYEMTFMIAHSGYAMKAGFSILRAGFFASIGLAAAGSFRREIDLNEALESVVEERSRKVRMQAQQLRILELALQASETAICITDSKKMIVWWNAAFARLTAASPSSCNTTGAFPLQGDDNDKQQQQHHHHVDHEICNQHLLNVLQPTDMGKGYLTKRFSLFEMVQDDIRVNDKFINAEIAPFPGFTEATPVSCPLKNQGNSKITTDSSTTTTPPVTMMHMITLRDVTAQTRADEAQRRADREAAANEMKTEMIQTLSHELRTPLQGVMGVVSTVLDDLAPEKGQLFDNLSTILASSRLLLTLINNVLDLRKIDSMSGLQFETTNVAVTDSIQESIQFCTPFATLNDVVVRLGPPQQQQQPMVAAAQEDASNWWRTVQASRIRLQQVLINLISNSIKYTTSGTEVIVSARRCTIQQAMHEARSSGRSDLHLMADEEQSQLPLVGDEEEVIVISVRDHGKGIPLDEFGKLFGEFSQLRSSAEKDRSYEGGRERVSATSTCQPSGSGLGLNLAMKLVRKMKGHIWCDNCTDGGGGAIFSFFLRSGDDPRTAAGVASSSATTPMQNGAGAAALDRNANTKNSTPAFRREMSEQFRVLIVDDSVINLKVLARMLRRLGVDQVETAPGGEEALHMLATTSFVPNLIISDLQMDPGMDGFELMTRLKKQSQEQSVQPGSTTTAAATTTESQKRQKRTVLACTAGWSPETEEKCMDVGFDGVLQKPVTLEDIRATLVDIATAAAAAAD